MRLGKFHPDALAKSKWGRRLATAGVAAPLFIVIVFSDVVLPRSLHGLPFALGVAFFSILGASEFYLAVRRQGAEPSDVLGWLACLVFQLSAWRRQGNQLDPYLPAFLALLVLSTLLSELMKRRQKPILNIGATLLGGIYVGWLFSYLTLLHGLNAPLTIITPPIEGTTAGQWLVIFTGAVTWMGDTGGLVLGHLFGRTKLAPEISPSKTYEGALGSVILGACMAVGLGWWLKMPFGPTLVLGLVLPVVGLVGDLCESALKRDLGLKDFGELLPGHGGVLDRIDSILFTAPVCYYYITLVVRHAG